MADEGLLTPEERRRLIASVEAEEARVEASESARTSNVRTLRPGMPRPGPASPPIPIEPDYGTDEWESWWLPEPVRAWVDAAAAAFNVPLVMPIAAALCAASVLLQGKARVRIHPAWEEELSLYWLVFAPTGMAKSGVMKAAIAPIRAIQQSIEDELTPVIAERSAERSRLEAQIQRMRRANKAHKYTEGAQEHLQQLRELEHELRECEVPKVPEWLVTDANPTVVPRLMAHNLAAENVARVAVCDSEGTFLANLMGRHSGCLNVDPMLAGYTGDPIDMVRTLHGSPDLQRFSMPSAHMTMCVMVQPHYLDLLRVHETLGDNGWLGRCIMSHVARDVTADPPFLRPEIPVDVQAGYADWLASLAGIEVGTVYEMPGELRSELERMHNEICWNMRTSEAAAGWSTRSLGRICRIFAVIALNWRTGELAKPGRGAEWVAREGIGKKILNYLYSALYLRQLTRAQAIEPARRTLTSLAARTLAWLRRSKFFASSPVTLKQICKGLRSKREDTLFCCDLLCQHGYLELIEEKRRHNNTLTVTYMVLSLGDEGTGEAVDS